jgi:hypothetical protein
MSGLREESATAPRDGLGQACFWLHIAVLVAIVGGWALPQRQALYVYLGFLPLMVLHWRLNGNSCVLNNLENWLRSGQWRDPKNREESQWLLTLVRSVTGLAFKPWQMDAISYGALLLLWGLGLWHLFEWQTP